MNIILENELPVELLLLLLCCSHLHLHLLLDLHLYDYDLLYAALLLFVFRVPWEHFSKGVQCNLPLGRCVSQTHTTLHFARYVSCTSPKPPLPSGTVLSIIYGWSVSSCFWNENDASFEWIWQSGNLAIWCLE